MEPFDFKQEDFVKLARMDPDEVLAAYQSSRIVVLSLKIHGTPLTTLLTLPPKGQYFAQDWWLGQAYSNWHLTAGFDEALVELILRSFKQSRIAFKRVPMNFLTMKGGIDRERGEGKTLILWDSHLFLSATIPSDAVDCALKAFEASQALVSDYLFVQRGNDYAPDASAHDKGQIDRAFTPEFTIFHGTAYRNPLMQMLAKHNLKIPGASPSDHEQKDFLQRTINDLDGVAVQSNSNRLELLRGAYRWQYFSMFDAREFEAELKPMVATVNTLRSRVLKTLSCPHFFASVALRLLDVALNTLQKKYRYLPNDRDWLLRLQKISPESLSSSFEESRNVDEYIAAMKEQYPCLADDPLREVLPKCPVQAFKI